MNTIEEKKGPSPRTVKWLTEVIHRDNQSNQRFCFILGAGASKSSGIPLGTELISKWREQLIEDCKKANDPTYKLIEESANAAGYDWDDCKHIFEDDYKPVSKDYFTVYDLLFAGTRNAGYNEIEERMKDATPASGYYCLAAILSQTHNNVIITTNFDHLAEDALLCLNGTHPLSLGHESLASFLDIDIKRPVIAKIHRDMLLNPMSHQEEMDKLSLSWEGPLRSVLTRCIPVVIGYAGGDHTLMDLLKDKDLNCKNIFWCTLSSDEKLDDPIAAIIAKYNGYWIKIDDFDDLMYQLANRLGVLPETEKVKDNLDTFYAKFATVLDKQRKKYLSGTPDNQQTVTEQSFDTAVVTVEEQSKNSPELFSYNIAIAVAWNMWHKGQKKEAIEKCSKMIEEFPNEARAYDARATMFHNNDEFEKALDDRNKTIELDPTNATYYLNRANTKNFMEMNEEALVDVDTAIGYGMTTSDVYTIRGTILADLNRREEALSDLSKSIEIYPRDGNTYHNRSVVYQELRRFDEALADADYAIKLDPGDATFHYSRGTTLHEMKRFDEALKEKDEAIRLEPENAEFHDGRGVTLHEMKRFDESLKAADEAIRLEPGNARFHHSRGVTLHEMKRFDEALKAKDEAIRLEPGNARFHDSRGITLHKMKRFDEALKEKDEAIRLDPGNAGFHASKAATFRDMGKLPEAEACIEQALRMGPETAYIRGVRSRILLRLGRVNAADQDADKAIALDSERPIGFFAKSEVLYQKKQYPKALEHIDKALETRPDDDVYLEHRRKILEAMSPDPNSGAPALTK